MYTSKTTTKPLTVRRFTFDYHYTNEINDYPSPSFMKWPLLSKTSGFKLYKGYHYPRKCSWVFQQSRSSESQLPQTIYWRPAYLFIYLFIQFFFQVQNQSEIYQLCHTTSIQLNTSATQIMLPSISRPTLSSSSSSSNVIGHRTVPATEWF